MNYNNLMLKYITGQIQETVGHDDLVQLNETTIPYSSQQTTIWLKGKNKNGVENGTLISISTLNLNIMIYDTNMLLLGEISLDKRIYSAIIDEQGRLIITQYENNAYVLKICNNITIPDQYGNYFIKYNYTHSSGQELIYKREDGGQYFTISGNTLYELKINIQEETTEKTYQIPGNPVAYDFTFDNNDNPKIVVFTNYDDPGDNKQYLRKYIKDYTEETFTLDEEMPLPSLVYGARHEITNCIIFKNELFGIVQAYVNDEIDSRSLYKYGENGFVLIKILQSMSLLGQAIPKPAYEIINGVLIYSFTTTYANFLYESYILTKDDYNETMQEIGTIEPGTNMKNAAIMYQNSLIQSYFSLNNTMVVSSILFNKDEYNSSPNETYKALLPYTGILWNDKMPVYAKKLYNQIVQADTITSTIEVPNMMLNNGIIEKEQLYTMQNLKMQENNEEIYKNQYEELFVNFNKIIKTADLNGGVVNEDINHLIAKNSSTNNILLMESTMIKYLQYSYIEDDEKIFVSLEMGTPIIENGVATYSIMLEPEGDIDNIDITVDGGIIYVSIKNNFKKGERYYITQKVRVR